MLVDSYNSSLQWAKDIYYGFSVHRAQISKEPRRFWYSLVGKPVVSNPPPAQNQQFLYAIKEEYDIVNWYQYCSNKLNVLFGANCANQVAMNQKLLDINTFSDDIVYYEYYLRNKGTNLQKLQKNFGIDTKYQTIIGAVNAFDKFQGNLEMMVNMWKGAGARGWEAFNATRAQFLGDAQGLFKQLNGFNQYFWAL